MNLERRAKWHYLLNEGFVPILETPSGYTVFESRIIMDYLEQAYTNKGRKLYLDNPADRAQQYHIMKIFDDVQSSLFEVLMSHGTSFLGTSKLTKAFDKLEHHLSQSRTSYFMN